VAILAKNLGIPAAVNLPDATRRIATGNLVALDATGGAAAAVYIDPDEAERRLLDASRIAYQEKLRRIATVRGLPPETPDGKRIIVSANIGSDAEAVVAREKGATSVGLFRSEFLFLGKAKLPDEEEQFRAYKAAAETFKDGFVIVRTLDVGGDKKVPSLSIPEEDNPFLGYRALRISLDRPDVFKPQLRAILRASHFGKLKMMFPMVSGVAEVEAARGILEECRQSLREQGVPFDEEMEVGVMIEIPSAVFMASELAQVVDFFSIGTNDLTQYLLAADRMNAHVQSYYRSLDPAVFRAIRTVVDAAHAKGKWVGICGELGGNPLAIPVLLGMGVDELSMSPQSVYEAIYTVRNTRYEAASSLAAKVFSLDSQESIATLLNSCMMREE
jgi:phosphoenolpyruvate-protein phosphotransferase (PTS system enzyme I)